MPRKPTPIHNLQNAREAAGLSVEELAAALHVSSSAIVRWEKDRATPHRAAVLALRKKLPAAFEPKKEEAPHVHDPTAAPGPAG